MSVTATNLTMGPGDLYKGTFGATEPADTAVNTTPAVSSWTDLGGTQDGVKLTVAQKYEELEVDQVVDIPGRRLTKREFMLETNLAEPTLENLVISINNSSAPATGSGYKSLDVSNDNSATQPTYIALIFDGYAPQNASGTTQRRRVIARKVLSVDDVEFSYAKADQTLFKVKFATHYVSSAIKPFRVVDEVAA